MDTGRAQFQPIEQDARASAHLGATAQKDFAPIQQGAKTDALKSGRTGAK